MKKEKLKGIATALSIFLIAACANPGQNSKKLATEENPDLSAKREVISRLLGDAPNFAQTSNGNFSAVVSRGYGRGAKAGALIEFFYPLYARDNLWDAYNGLFYQGKTTWFHELELLNQSVVEDSGIIRSEFQTRDKKISLKTEDVALRDSDTLARHVEITNRSNAPLNGLKIFFYECFTLNYAGIGDEVRYDPGLGALVHSKKDLTFFIGAKTLPDQWQCGQIENPFGLAGDARKDAEDGVLKKNASTHGLLGLGVNGSLEHDLGAIQPGQTFSIDYFLCAGSAADFQRARSQSWESIERSDKTFWKNWLAKGKMPRTPDPRIQKVYRRALITMKQDTANNGAIIAAPTLLSPVYSFTWPRDGAISASAYLAAGYPEEAKNFIDFICRQQKENGGWAVNFFMDGSRPLWDFGDRKNEHDQVGTVVWIIEETYKNTKDLAWLQGKWGIVRKACDFLISYLDPSGLMTPCRDLWELRTDNSWTFTNAAAFAGLSSGARIAAILGDLAARDRYQNAAAGLKEAIEKKLWSSAGFYYKGIDPKSGKTDSTIEAANLGLSYPFEVIPADSPRMAAMADKIYDSLTSPLKGVKRYTGDRYYDGNPWPATTDWLAIHYKKQGRLDRALELHKTVTDYAFSTNSLMLGEQFDEQQKLWVSAFPLTWSEAKYVLGSLDLF